MYMGKLLILGATGSHVIGQLQSCHPIFMNEESEKQMFSIVFCNLLAVKIDCNHAYVMLLLSNLFFFLISLFSNFSLVFAAISL